MNNTELLRELENYKKTQIDKDNSISIELSTTYGNVFTYGTTPYLTFKKLIEGLKFKPKRFIVVGASIGWMCFYWNELFPTIPTKGIDLHTHRISFGNDLIEKYNLKNIKLATDNLYDFEFKNGDLIWESNLCFPQSKVVEINSLILNKLDNVSIISYRPISRCEGIERDKIKSCKLPVSWAPKQTFYTYEKL